MGKPVIGADVGGVSEVIKKLRKRLSGRAGQSVCACRGNYKDAKDKEAARLMGMEGRKIVEKDYTVEKMCERMYALYLSLIKDRTQ